MAELIDLAGGGGRARARRAGAGEGAAAAEASAEVDGEPGEVTMVYVGHPHGQTDRYIEVIAAHRPPRTITIFHAMPLSDLFRNLLNEGK